MEPYLITKEEFDLVLSDNISVKQQKEIVAKIAERVNYVIRKAAKVDWWDFMGGGDRVDGNFFDSCDGEYLTLDGEYKLPKPYYSVENWFPVYWLWQDFQEEFNREVGQYKKDELAKKISNKQQREQLKIKKAEMKELIKNKLSKEELKFIKFK